MEAAAYTQGKYKNEKDKTNGRNCIHSLIIIYSALNRRKIFYVSIHQ
jgi:hypothetical protein